MIGSEVTGIVPSWQPTLRGDLIDLRPLSEVDFEAVFLAASDPLIWEQHPDRERFRRERFELFFRSGIDSKGALAVLDRESGSVIGCSRFTAYDAKSSSVEIGYTFLTRACWGKGYNRELKKLMLDYAFGFVNSVLFFVGETNLRSQKAMQKVGGREVRRVISAQIGGESRVSVVYRIDKQNGIS